MATLKKERKNGAKTRQFKGEQKTFISSVPGHYVNILLAIVASAGLYHPGWYEKAVILQINSIIKKTSGARETRPDDLRKKWIFQEEPTENPSNEPINRTEDLKLAPG